MNPSSRLFTSILRATSRGLRPPVQVLSVPIVRCPSLKSWHIPSWSGDYALVREEALLGVSRLEFENLTEGEYARVTWFLHEAIRRRWITEIPHVPREGRGLIRLEAPLEEAGVVIAALTTPPRGSLTAVRSRDGTISVDIDPATLLEDVAVEPEESSEAEAGAQARHHADTARQAMKMGVEKKTGAEEKTDSSGKDPIVAATVKRPTPCCPESIEGREVRANRLLQAFCTTEQWEDWTREGYLIVFGGLTGHAYMLAHRHSRRAILNGKICRDLDDDCVVHFHDWTVPPPEEVLASMLILGSRHEDWLRNGSTVLCGGRDVFLNPLGSPGLDGTTDAALTSTFGQMFQLWAPSLRTFVRAVE